MKKFLMALMLQSLMAGMAAWADYSYPTGYTIMFDGCGGTGKMKSVVKKWDWMARDDEPVYTLPECKFKREGYVFAGWNVYNPCVTTDEGDNVVYYDVRNRKYIYTTFDERHYENDTYDMIGGLEGCFSVGANIEICGTTLVSATWKKIDTTAYYLYKKARTVTGLCLVGDDESNFTGGVYIDYNHNSVAFTYGMASVKIGAINKRNGTVKVSATITPFAGKKLTASTTVAPYTDGSLYGALNFKSPVGIVPFVCYWDETDGEMLFDADWECQEYEDSICWIESGFEIGGSLDSDVMYFSIDDFDCDELDVGDDFYVVEEALPCEVEFEVKNGTKWTFPRSSTLKYKKYTEDGYSWYELDGLYDNDGDYNPNASGLKLTYSSKTGSFKGQFYVYATNEGNVDERKKPTLKKYKATIQGFVIDGQGYGTAAIKIGKRSYKWQISI